ncbi:MAG: DUF2812 domain-containing protein [Clostridiales bacterium]|nr:DUF2812 domain-containing protein [Clostridiales bacterium]
MRHKEKNERLVLVPFAISNIPLLYKWISELAEKHWSVKGAGLGWVSLQRSQTQSSQYFLRDRGDGGVDPGQAVLSEMESCGWEYIGRFKRIQIFSKEAETGSDLIPEYKLSSDCRKKPLILYIILFSLLLLLFFALLYICRRENLPYDMSIPAIVWSAIVLLHVLAIIVSLVIVLQMGPKGENNQSLNKTIRIIGVIDHYLRVTIISLFVIPLLLSFVI